MKTKQDEIIKEYITWSQFQNDVKTIYNKILKDNKTYDAIVSVGRGGMVLSRLLAEYLNIREVHIFNIYSYIDKKSGDVKTIESFDINLLNFKKILIVDDVCTTGKTLTKIKKEIYYEGCSIDFNIVTEYCNNTSAFIPDYYAKMYNANNTWLVFPWEKDI